MMTDHDIVSAIRALQEFIDDECTKDKTQLRANLLAMLLVAECIQLKATEASITFDNLLRSNEPVGNWIVTIEKKRELAQPTATQDTRTDYAADGDG